MSIKSIIVNVILPLAITIIGGVILYHYSDTFNKSPRLTYSISLPAHFDFAGEIVTSNTIGINNNLEGKVENVVILIGYQDPINELKVAKDSNNSITYLTEVSDDKMSAAITIPFLRSNETFIFQIFTQSSSALAPKISVTSENHVAKAEEKLLNIGRLEEKEGAGALLVTATSALVALLAAAGLRTGLQRVSSALRGTHSINNTGFVLLHLGIVDEALSIFKKSIEQRGASPYEFSNLALCYALKEDFEKANIYLLASEFLVNTDTHPIIILNQGLTKYLEGDKIQAKEILATYKGKHGRAYKHYIKFSKPLQMAEAELNL